MFYADTDSTEKTVEQSGDSGQNVESDSTHESQPSNSEEYSARNIISESEIDKAMAKLIIFISIFWLFWFPIVLFIPALPGALASLPGALIMLITGINQYLVN